MSELISGEEAKLAWANGQDVELSQKGIVMDWCSDFENYSCGVFNNNRYIFRLKPRTITINGVELNQCYSVAIDYAKNEVKVEFKNRNDAEALHDVISKLYGFK